MGLIIIFLICAFLGFVISVVVGSLFSSTATGDEIVFWWLMLALLGTFFVSWFFLGLGIITWEQYFYGFNWISNLWEWARTPL